MMGVSLAQNVYDDPYDLAVSDPRFLAAATAAHAGRWSLLDALWWEWHPEDPAPSGSPSPILRLRELQRRVFAADGDAAGDHSVAQAVRELEAEIVAERAAVTEAITAAHADLRSRTAGRQNPDPLYPDPSNADPAVETSAAPAAGAYGTADPATPATEAAAGAVADRTGRRRIRPGVIAALALALVVAAAIGAVLGSLLPTAGPLAAPSPSATATATATPPGNPAVLFAQAQRPQDIPAQLMPATFEADSFRYLGSTGWAEDANLVGRWPFYAARAAGGLICLVAMPEGSGYLSTCAGEAAYPATGLRLSWESADYLAQLPPDFYVEEGMEDMIGDVTVVWGRTGEVTSEMTMRSPAGP